VFDPDSGVRYLDDEGGIRSEAEGINNWGQVVGVTAIPSDPASPYAFIDSGGQVVNLNSFLAADSGLRMINAIGINDRGQIVAFGVDHNSVNLRSSDQFYLLTPVPGAGSFGVANMAKVLMVDPTARSTISSTEFTSGDPLIPGFGLKS